MENKPNKNNKEYSLSINDLKYKINIQLNENDISIKTSKYSYSSNINNISQITGIKFNTISEAYEFLINIFNKNKVAIKNEKIYDTIILIFEKEKNKHFEITLKYQYTNPKTIDFLSNIKPKSVSFFESDNKCIVFYSINYILVLIYTGINNSIICYDLEQEKVINEIKNCHKKEITSFNHYLDKKNKRDLFMSISSLDKNIKIWNFNNLECILNLITSTEDIFLFSACFFEDKNELYLVSSESSDLGLEPLIIYDLKGTIIREIKEESDIYHSNPVFIDIYYDKNFSKNYIIFGTDDDFVKSFDYNENKYYHRYIDTDIINNTLRDYCYSLIIIENENIIKLIGSGNCGLVKIWNFHTGILIKKIKVFEHNLYGICLWNKDYLFIGGDEKIIKIIELNTGRYATFLTEHNDTVLTIKKIIHPKYGECFLSLGYNEDYIKLFLVNKKSID